MSHLKKLMAKNGITQTDLARLLGRDKSVVTNLFQGRRQLKADEATVIARHIGVPVSQILGEPERAGGFAEPVMLIPFQHEPEHCKQFSNVVKKDGKFFLEVEENEAYSTKTYAMEARDDSMNMAGILPGDILISELDRSCRSGQVVIAQYYQGRGAKTIIRQYDSPFLLPRSTNHSHKILHVEKDEVRLVSPVIKLIRMF